MLSNLPMVTQLLTERHDMKSVLHDSKTTELVIV